MAQTNNNDFPTVEGIDLKLWTIISCGRCQNSFGFIRFNVPKLGIKCPQCAFVTVIDFSSGFQNSQSNRTNYNQSHFNAQSNNNANNSNHVEVGKKDTLYYEYLGVEVTSSPDEIKRAYYKMARLHHPDKHPDDAEAESRFKMISEAYQVLSDPVLREKYDKYGKESLAPQGGFAAPREFFAQLFGGGRFKDFIGEEFMIAGVMDDSITPEQRDADLVKKVNQLSVKLEERLETFVRGELKFFEQDTQAVVEELKGENYGVEILNTIGYIYEQEGRKALGGFFGFAANISGRAHTVGSSFSAIKSAIQLQNKQKEMDLVKDESKKQALEEQLMKDGMATMWKVGKLEVEATLRQVCEQILAPVPGADPNIYKKRAEGLKVMGKIFQSVKLKAN